MSILNTNQEHLEGLCSQANFNQSVIDSLRIIKRNNALRGVDNTLVLEQILSFKLANVTLDEEIDSTVACLGAHRFVK